MGCTNSKATEAFYHRFHKSIVENRVPVNGSIELTSKCNFSCIHCYNSGAEVHDELDTAQWQKILNEIADSGTLFLLITGGEPLLRHDFVDIYTHAIRKGLIVTLFTNGSLITDEHIQLFCKYPPRNIEISLYGANDRICGNVTSMTSMGIHCMQNCRTLVENNINVLLKTVIMTENLDDYGALKRFAEELGVPFRFDTQIFPTLRGDRAPLQYRLEPEQAVDLTLSSDELVNKWIKNAENLQDAALPEELYACGAAVNSFHVDAKGFLSPCMMIDDIRYDLKKGNFIEGWQKVLPHLWKKKVDADLQCKNCSNLAFCDYCPAFFRLETGSENIVSPFLCKVGGLMAEKLNNRK